MKRFWSFSCFLLFSQVLLAQNDIQYTHFVFNKLAYNPAYAGIGGQPILTTIYRNQWIKLEGTPTTATANFHTPFSKDRVGFGLGISTDKVGMLRVNTIEANYAYRFSVKNGKLSLGINGRFEQRKIDWTQANPLDLGDERIPSIGTSSIKPNIGLGMYYEQANYYLGFSIPKLLKTSIYQDVNTSDQNGNLRTSYLMGGFLSKLSEQVKIQPGAMISWNTNVPFELDLNVNLIFMDAFWLGGSYRVGDAFSGLIQYQFTPQIRTGIAFDFTMSALNSYTNGSLELMLSIGFGKQSTTVEQINHLRYF